MSMAFVESSQRQTETHLNTHTLFFRGCCSSFIRGIKSKSKSIVFDFNFDFDFDLSLKDDVDDDYD